TPWAAVETWPSYRAPATADAPRTDRLELRPPARPRARRLAAAVGVRRHVFARRREGGRSRRGRTPRVPPREHERARRQVPLVGQRRGQSGGVPAARDDARLGARPAAREW